MVAAAALLVAYYALPIGLAGGRMVVGLFLTGVGLVALGVAIMVQTRRELRGAKGARPGTLAMMLCLVVVLFSVAYFLMERAGPEQVAGLSTRTDALYFTLSTLATVGYGDVHATGQAARAVVSAQIVFNLVLVGGLVHTITARLRRQRGGRVEGADRPG